MRSRYGMQHDSATCGRFAKFHRVSKRRSYACDFCGGQVYPCAGTPFENRRTPLRDWLFVMFPSCTTRNGVSAKEIERDLGVTYKTAMSPNRGLTGDWLTETSPPSLRHRPVAPRP